MPCLVSALFALRGGAALRSAVSCVVRNVSLTIIMSKIVRCGGGGGYGADCAVAAVLTVTRVFMVIQVSLISRRTQKAATTTAAAAAAPITGMKWVKIELGALIASRRV